MSRIEILTLKRLCSKQETHAQAIEILNATKLKTGSGTGYDLGQGASGLPAICAYIASERLNNNDVAKKVAQTASCLAPKIFESTLATVKAALLAKPKDTARPKRGMIATYEDLISRFISRRTEFMIECMEDTEKTLVESKELKGKVAPPSNVATVVVFCWVGKLLNLKKVNPDALQEEFGISDKDWNTVTEVIDSTCRLVEKDIRLRVTALREGLKNGKMEGTPATPSGKAAQRSPAQRVSALVPPPRSPPKTQTPSRLPPPSRSPSKSALKAPSVEASPSKTPTHKRKVVFSTVAEDGSEFDGPDLETPSRKKRKLTGSPVKLNLFPTSAAKPLPALNLKPGSRSTPSSSRVKLDDIPESAAEASAESNAELDDVEVDMPIIPIPTTTPTPSTPRRPRKSAANTNPPHTPSEYYGTPSRSVKKHQPMSRATEQEEEVVMPRRTRPVLAAYKQWIALDPRLERELRLAEVAKTSLVEKFGHPFEHLRSAAVEAGVA
ncbi:hypothetical protein BXZ70DRAFT_1075516 [Cristinia sonorae]|uniref:Origin recognition complex subunit 6 n=1 Tax=Cristinia sonorae TaxID=1940300 RepID=A0A8K0UWE4_9AGAR|nr:hypothetical protein BXZ70DRAFT_1075516 [Cristinia sonorae]